MLFSASRSHNGICSSKVASNPKKISELYIQGHPNSTAESGMTNSLDVILITNYISGEKLNIFMEILDKNN